MEPIEWNDSFSVGVALFDEHHQHLIGILNRLIADPAATTRSETVADVLTDMTNYARMHFRSEEELMAAHDFPLMEEHQDEHNEFREKVARFCMATTNGEMSVPQELLGYLQQWLIHHILQSDMAYKPFFEEKGIR